MPLKKKKLDNPQWTGRCPQTAPSPGGSRPSSNTWFLGHTQVHIPNGISIESAVLSLLTDVTNRHKQTGMQTTEYRQQQRSLRTTTPHLSQVCQKCNTLNRLSKTHFIGQYSIDALIIQVHQPVHALPKQNRKY